MSHPTNQKGHGMRRLVVAVLIAVTGVVALAGCGSGHSAAVSSVSTNPQTLKAEAVIRGCVAHSDLFTKGGRKAFVSCIAPPGKEVAVEKCFTRKLSADGFLTKRDRLRLANDVAGCIV
jgi:hypothetical protein